MRKKYFEKNVSITLIFKKFRKLLPDELKLVKSTGRKLSCSDVSHIFFILYIQEVIPF